MLYDFKKDFDIEMYNKRSKELIEKKAIVDLRAKRKKATLSQNSYLHVCINMYAIFIGETLNITKTDLKRDCPFMVFKHNGRQYLRSSTDLDRKGKTEWIEWIRNHASVRGVFIPSPDDYRRNWAEYEKNIEACKPYL